MGTRLTRVLQKIFGVNAGANQIGQFGSLASGSPTTTTDPEVIQSLANFETGWYGAILGNNSPAIQDVNALAHLMFRQLAYIMQSGVPEWETNTEYFIGSFVSNGAGSIYKSITDNNIGNALTDPANWTIVVGADAVLTANIKDLNVTTGKLANGAVTQAKRASLGQQISGSSGNFTTIAGTKVDVTNLSVTITTTGRPVFVGLIHDGNTSNESYLGSLGFTGTNALCSFHILRASTIISSSRVSKINDGASNSYVNIPPSSLSYIDTPSAGTHTYKVQAETSTATTMQATVAYAKLVVFEL